MAADSSNLDQPIPEGRREEWAALLAATTAKAHDKSTQRLFLFRVQGEWFGVDPAVLAMTIPHVRPRQLPHQRGRIVDGLINADGRVILCLSMERFAGVQAQAGADSGRRMLVFSWQKWIFAMAVSEIQGVEDVTVDEGASLPESANESLRKCARSIVLHRGRAVIALEAKLLMEQLAEALR